MHYQDLYSHYYEEIGVLFAACPNFTDHYTEDAISKDGLEWMRVLNEILSDYDDLLNNPRFKGIITYCLQQEYLTGGAYLLYTQISPYDCLLDGDSLMCYIVRMSKQIA